jgi:hypothetical protein
VPGGEGGQATHLDGDGRIGNAPGGFVFSLRIILGAAVRACADTYVGKNYRRVDVDGPPVTIALTPGLCHVMFGDIVGSSSRFPGICDCLVRE